MDLDYTWSKFPLESDMLRSALFKYYDHKTIVDTKQ